MKNDIYWSFIIYFKTVIVKFYPLNKNILMFEYENLNSKDAVMFIEWCLHALLPFACVSKCNCYESRWSSWYQPEKVDNKNHIVWLGKFLRLWQILSFIKGHNFTLMFIIPSAQSFSNCLS